MGNSMKQMSDRKFRIENMSKFMALKAVKSLIDHSETVKDMSGSHWRWVYPRDIARVSTLEEALSVWHWKPSTDSGGNIIDLICTIDKEGDDDILFHTIAPFVTSGSYIKVVINDRTITWNFQSGRCIKEIV